MSKELVVSANRHETRVAILEDDQPVEVYHQRENEYSLAGSIHKGRVTRVLPGMQSAFVDIGLERDAFLYVSDFFEDNEEYDKIVTSVEDKVLKMEKTGPPPAPSAAAPVASEPAPAPAAETAAPVVAPPPDTPPPAPDQYPRHNDGERRGRRSRRRRRGRGLPESKYFSPVPHAERAEPAPAPPPAPEEAVEAEPETDEDLFMLPGESLAKYRDSDEETAPEPAVEDVPASESIDAAPAEPVEVDDAPVEPIDEGETETVEPAEAPVEAEPPVSIEAAAASEEELAAPPGEIVDEEQLGPEPARIPTSLTATLREQGPRYLHRVSRRMRRRGRGEPDFRAPEVRSETRQVSRPEPARVEKSASPSISDLLREGQEIIVQIAKEPLGQKGARITSHIALPGRFLVYMPTVDHIGVSRKIPSDDERIRLKRILQSNRTGIPGGFIVRTAGDGRTEEELRADMHFLYNLWLDLRQKAEKKPAPALIHRDLDVVERILRDQLTGSFKNIWVDNEEVYESVLRFVERFQPALVSRVKLYTRNTPIFDEFGITQELEKALRPKVWLKTGGYIVINQTEALVAIDVNTGKFVGKSNRLEDTIVRTNTDAIKEIVRQIRLRDLGGIIVVDFIDMDERKNRQKVMQALEEAMRADRAPYKILQFNDFGLVAITRKRVKQSLERTLCTACPYCEGSGYVKSVSTVIREILEEAHKIADAVEGNDVTLRVHPEVGKVLKSSRNTYLQELEEVLGRTVLVKSDPLLHQEKFDLA